MHSSHHTKGPMIYTEKYRGNLLQSLVLSHGVLKGCEKEIGEGKWECQGVCRCDPQVQGSGLTGPARSLPSQSSVLLGQCQVGWGYGNPPKAHGVFTEDRQVDGSPCPERSVESCRASFPAAISRVYLPLSESLGSRMWSQISSRVVPALTRSPLSRRFSLNTRANVWLTWCSPSVLLGAGCLPAGLQASCPQLLSGGFVSRFVVTTHEIFLNSPSTHPFIIHPSIRPASHQLLWSISDVPLFCLYLGPVLQAGSGRKWCFRVSDRQSLPHLFILLI